MLWSCGKDSKNNNEQSYLSGLQGAGIDVVANSPYLGARVAVICQNNGTTIMQKGQQLQAYRQSLGLQSGGYSGGYYGGVQTGVNVAGVMLTPQQADYLFGSALMELQYSNPNSTFCPTQVLSAL
jgi:hypothetical protein